MLTVNRPGLPLKLRRSLACTNSIENMMGTVRRVCRNVKRWRNVAMALRWTAAGMLEAAKGFRRLKAYKHLPALRVALAQPTSAVAVPARELWQSTTQNSPYAADLPVKRRPDALKLVTSLGPTCPPRDQNCRSSPQ